VVINERTTTSSRCLLKEALAIPTGGLAIAAAVAQSM